MFSWSALAGRDPPKKVQAQNPLSAAMCTWRKEVIAPCIPDLGTKCDWVVSVAVRGGFTPRTAPRYPLFRRLGRSQSRSGRFGEEKNSWPCRDYWHTIRCDQSWISGTGGILHYELFDNISPITCSIGDRNQINYVRETRSVISNSQCLSHVYSVFPPTQSQSLLVVCLTTVTNYIQFK